MKTILSKLFHSLKFRFTLPQSEMLVSDILELSVQRFKIKQLRTFLTVLGIGIGIGTVFFLVSLIFGLQKLVVGNIATSDTLLTLDVLPNTEVRNIVYLNDKRIAQFKKVQGVEKISATKALSGEINMNNIKTQTTVYGVDHLYFQLTGVNPRTGEVFTDKEKNKVVVSSSILSLYGIPEKNAIGKKFRMAFIISPDTLQHSTPEASSSATTQFVTVPSQFTIAGVVDDTSNYMYIHKDNFSVVEMDEYKYIKLKVKDAKAVEPVREQVLSQGFLVTAMTDTLDQIDKIFQVTQFIFTIIGIVALFIAAIGMFNTMTIALLERTREIGIMKAIGATDRAIYQMFLTESVIMGVGGSLIGLLVGYVSTTVAGLIVNMIALSLGGEWVNFFYTPPWFISIVLVFGLLIGFATGFFPARRASQLNPLTALRYE